MMRHVVMQQLQKTGLLGSIGITLLSVPLAHASTHHVVEAGETLSGIAAKYDLSKTLLIDANGLQVSHIKVGEVLNIPDPNTKHNIYRVVAGDSLHSLSDKYGISVEALARANHMSPQSGLMIDSTLIIPMPPKKAVKPAEKPAPQMSVVSANIPKASPTPRTTTKAATTAPVKAPSGQSSQTHRIEYGETLLSIAKKHNVSLSDLATANNMAIDDVLYFGRTLTIPTNSVASPRTSAQPVAVQTAPKTYKVKAGDTLMGIANRHQVNFFDIAAKSSISPYDALAIGQVLTLPSNARAVTNKDKY